MIFDRRRLIDVISESIGRIASRSGIPDGDMDCLSAATALGELVRSEGPAGAREFYAAGHALALSLLECVGEDKADATDMARLQRLPPAITESTDNISSQGFLLELKQLLSSLMIKSGYPTRQDGELRQIVSSVCKWEGALLQLPAAGTAKAKNGHDVKQMLESSARAQGDPFAHARIVELTKLVGGFANETTLFKLADNNGRIWDLVARASTGLQFGIEGRDIGGEFFLLRYLYEQGVTVAEPIWLEDDVERYAAKFLVTRKVEGGNFGTVVEAQRLNSDQMKALAAELARIHALPLDKAHPHLQRSHIDTELVGASTTEAITNYLERWVALWRSTGLANSPTVEATLAWLRSNMPQIEDAPILVHGDYGLHNIVMQGNKIGGVLDWEMSHLGDRAEDISGLLSSFQNESDAKEFMHYYIEAGGSPVSDFMVKYCNVFRFFGMYVVMLESQLIFNTLPEIHPELLVLGSNFIQVPAARMAQAIENAEKAKSKM